MEGAGPPRRRRVAASTTKPTLVARQIAARGLGGASDSAGTGVRAAQRRRPPAPSQRSPAAAPPLALTRDAHNSAPRRSICIMYALKNLAYGSNKYVLSEE